MCVECVLLMMFTMPMTDDDGIVNSSMERRMKAQRQNSGGCMYVNVR